MLSNNDQPIKASNLHILCTLEAAVCDKVSELNVIIKMTLVCKIFENI